MLAHPAPPPAPATTPPPEPEVGVRYKSKLEEAVKGTTTLSELEATFGVHLIESLEPREVLLFCNHLARITNSVTTTVKEWSQTEALYERLLSGLKGRLDELSSYELVVLLSSMARCE